jgi:hypothetical protein
MPTSAIQAGYAIYVLPVEKMPEQLLNYTRNLSVRMEKPTPAPAVVSGMNRILMLLRSGTGHDFSQYKKSTIGRRIERRMSQHNIEDTEVYARYLKEHPAEVQTLFKELLINITSFFRDPEAFLALKQDILPQLFAGKPGGYVFRVWVAGCATGEEMQPTNEELQSTNEELETSKEELQSVNEELITVNAELQAKIEQLAGIRRRLVSGAHPALPDAGQRNRGRGADLHRHHQAHRGRGRGSRRTGVGRGYCRYGARAAHRAGWHL